MNEKVVDVSTVKSNGVVELSEPLLQAMDLKEGDYVSWDVSKNQNGKPQLILKKQKSRYIEIKTPICDELREYAEKRDMTVDEFATEIVKEFLLSYHEQNRSEDN